MFLARWTKEGGWKSEGAVPFANISMPPSAQVLNYGQGLFEGMKALTSVDGGIVLFRPKENAMRMRSGAERMCMQPVPPKLFLEGIEELVAKNATHVRTATFILRCTLACPAIPRLMDGGRMPFVTQLPLGHPMCQTHQYHNIRTAQACFPPSQAVCLAAGAATGPRLDVHQTLAPGHRWHAWPCAST
jgi:hypothetical protein